MTHNPYAPPVAVVADAPQEASALPVFHAVSPLKLIVLSFGTFGIYQYYWLYRNWKLHRQRTGEEVLPLARAIFAIFFVYQLFRHIDGEAEKWNTRRVPSGALATCWIVCALTWRLPDPYWLVTFLAAVFLVPVQQAVNAINAMAVPGHDANARFRGWNWVAIFVGLPFFALAVFGTFLPQP